MLHPEDATDIFRLEYGKYCPVFSAEINVSSHQEVLHPPRKRIDVDRIVLVAAFENL